MRFLSYTKLRPSEHSRGFSILEVLVTAGIIGIITTIIAFRYGSFNNAVLLKNQAYEIALDLREAQVIALSALGHEVGGSSEFREDYGLYFNIADDAGRQQYLMFQDQGDLVEDGRNVAYYDSEPVDERIGPTVFLDSRFKIARICVNILDENNNCPYQVEDLSVSFKRPNFDAQFASVDGSDQGIGVIYNVRIEVVNALEVSEAIRAVVVNGTGQIYVTNSQGGDEYYESVLPDEVEEEEPPPDLSGPPFYSMVLHKRQSDSSCRYGTSWGWDTDRIWVDNGCRATFKDDANICYQCNSRDYKFRQCTAPYGDQTARICN